MLHFFRLNNASHRLGGVHIKGCLRILIKMFSENTTGTLPKIESNSSTEHLIKKFRMFVLLVVFTECVGAFDNSFLDIEHI